MRLSTGRGKAAACSSTKVPVHGTSYEIDERVKEIVAEGLSIYRVDADRLRELRPDLILTQTQCAVCAVTPRDLEQALCTWTGVQPAIVSLEPNNLDDVWNDIRRVAEALGVPDRAETLIASLTKRLAAIRKETRMAQSRPTVAAIEWLEPLMAGGNWMPDLIEIAGGHSLLAQPNEHSSWLDWASLIEADPEVILLVPCGFKIPQTIRDLNLLTENPGWATLRAVQQRRVYLIDGHHFFNRPGLGWSSQLKLWPRFCIRICSALAIAELAGSRWAMAIPKGRRIAVARS